MSDPIFLLQLRDLPNLNPDPAFLNEFLVLSDVNGNCLVYCAEKEIT